MAFATLEEAWGMPRLQGPPTDLLPAAPNKRIPGLAPQPHAQLHAQQPHTQPPAAKSSQFPARAPTRTPSWTTSRRDVFDGDAGAIEARDYLMRAYAKFGLEGVVQLLPRQAVVALARGGGGRGTTGRGGGFGSWLADLVSSPEKVLVLLLAVFALVLLMDRSSAPADMGLAHMHPFPMVPGLTLTASS